MNTQLSFVIFTQQIQNGQNTPKMINQTLQSKNNILLCASSDYVLSTKYWEGKIMQMILCCEVMAMSAAQN